MKHAARVLAAAALVVAATVAAAAQGPVRGDAASLKLKPSKGPPTTAVHATGSGFAAGETVDLSFDLSEVASTTADGGGEIAATFSVPASAAPGPHHVKATGESSHVSARHTFTVQTDWPAQRYSATKTGSNPFENQIDTANVDTLTSAWTSPNLGAPEDTSPVEVGGVVYVADHGTDVWAFDATTGAVEWHTVIPSFFCCNMSDLTVDKGVVFGSFSKEIWALSAATGAVLWHTCDYVAGTCEAESALGAPTVAGGRIFAGDENGNLYAFSESTGTVMWTAALSGDLFDAIETAPAVDTSSKTLYLQDDSNRFYAIKTSNGHVRWTGNRPTLPLPVGGFTGNVPTPALSDGTVFVASYVDGNLTAFAAGGCGAKKCDPLWTTSMHGSGGSSPAVADGMVYVGAQTPDRSSFSIMAVDAATGAEVWNSGVVPLGSFSGEEGPTVENGIVYAGSANGAVYGFDATAGTQLWTASLGGGASTPVVVNGHVYVGNGNGEELLAFALP